MKVTGKNAGLISDELISLLRTLELTQGHGAAIFKNGKLIASTGDFDKGKESRRKAVVIGDDTLVLLIN